MQAVGTVGEICSRNPIAVSRDTTVAEAAKIMRHHHIGTLVICDYLSFDRRLPVGIVTDRDIVVEVVASDLAPGAVTVGEIMTPELVTVRQSSGVREALELMRQKGVRRVVVLDHDGLLSGVVAIDDVLEALAEELTNVSQVIGRERGIEAANRK